MHQEMLNEQYWAEAPPFRLSGEKSRLAATGLIEGNIVAGSVVGRTSSMLGNVSTVAVAAGIRR
jgi:hypothetical protein